MSAIDQLTGLPTHQSLAGSYQAMPKEAKRTEMSFALLDIDSFIYVNDQFGWQVADQILRDIADILREETKDHSISLFRVGGDEFVLSTMEETREEFISVLKKIQEIIYQRKFPFQGHPDKARDRVTISVAISFVPFATATDFRARLNELANRIVEAKRNSEKGFFQVFSV